MTTEERGSVERKAEEREHLRQIIKQWNANRLELFELTVPNEELEFHGVMRYYFQDAGQKVATKCIRVSSTASTDDVIQTLIEKFRPDIRMLSVPEYALYEIHENGEERKLAEDEKPLLVQLNWHIDDREGRFLLRRMDEKTYLPGFEPVAINFKRKLSKREKKDKKKWEKKEKSKENSDKGKDGIAEKLYSELPETSFTRSISNPEAVMKRRRQQKLEKKLQQLCQEGGTEAGGTVRIFAETLNKDVPYKTLLLSTRDEAAHVVREILEKYGKNKEKDAPHYCLVQLIVPHNNADGIREYILDDDDCPLAIEKQHFRSRGTLSFHIKRRPADYQPRKRKMKPKQIEAESEDGISRRPREDHQFAVPQPPSPAPSSVPTSQTQTESPEAEAEAEPEVEPEAEAEPEQPATDPRGMEQLLKLLLLQANDQLPPDQRDSLGGLSQERAAELLTQTGHLGTLGNVQVGPKIDVIYLQKGNNGMGLSIVATKAAGQDMLGIYIKSVVKGGAADKDGRLQAGDQLLKVDGHSLIGISQERAAELMTQTGPVVTLDVAKQAAAFNGLAAFLHQPSPPIPSPLQPHFRPSYCGPGAGACRGCPAHGPQQWARPPASYSHYENGSLIRKALSTQITPCQPETVRRQDHGPPPDTPRKQVYSLPPDSLRIQEHFPLPDALRRQEHCLPPENHRRPEYNHSQEALRRQELCPTPDSLRRQEHFLPPDNLRRQEHGLPPDALRRQEHGLPPDALRRQEHGLPPDALRRQEHGLPPDSFRRQEHSLPSDAFRRQEHSLPPDALRRQEHCLPPDALRRHEHGLHPDSLRRQEHSLPPDAFRRQEPGMPSDSLRRQEHCLPPDALRRQEHSLPPDTLRRPDHGLHPDAIRRQEHNLPSDTIRRQEHGLHPDAFRRQEQSLPSDTLRRQEHSLSQEALRRQEHSLPPDAMRRHVSGPPLDTLRRQEHVPPPVVSYRYGPSGYPPRPGDPPKSEQPSPQAKGQHSYKINMSAQIEEQEERLKRLRFEEIKRHQELIVAQQAEHNLLREAKRRQHEDMRQSHRNYPTQPMRLDILPNFAGEEVPPPLPKSPPPLETNPQQRLDRLLLSDSLPGSNGYDPNHSKYPPALRNGDKIGNGGEGHLEANLTEIGANDVEGWFMGPSRGRNSVPVPDLSSDRVWRRSAQDLVAASRRPSPGFGHGNGNGNGNGHGLPSTGLGQPQPPQAPKKVSWEDSSLADPGTESRSTNGQDSPVTPSNGTSNNSFTLQDIDDVLGTPGEPSSFIGITPNVIGAQEVYRDPRERIKLEKMRNQPQRPSIQGPEKLSFKEKMEMFRAEESLADK